MPNFEIRPARPEDDRILVEQFRTNFGRPVSENDPLAHWEWKYRRAPYGGSRSLVAESGGEIVGHVGALPRLISYGGRVRSAALLVDGWAVPRIRHAGVSRDLFDAHRMALARAGVETLLAVASRPMAKRILTRDPRWCPSFRMSVLAKPSWALPTKPPDIEMAEAAVAGSLDSRFATLDNRSETTLVRDEPYLKWRFVTCPDPIYRLWLIHDADGRPGYLATRIAHRVGIRVGCIADISLSLTTPSVAASLVAALAHLRSQAVMLVACAVRTDSNAAAALRSAGFREVPGIRSFSGFTEGLASRDPIPVIPHVTWGDTDVI